MNLPAFESLCLLCRYTNYRFSIEMACDRFCAISLFDMLKPWPISWLDKRVHGGFGIRIDDLVGGVMAAISFAAIGYWLEWLPAVPAWDSLV